MLALLAVAAEAVWLRPRHDDFERHKADGRRSSPPTQRFVNVANTYTPDTLRGDDPSRSAQMLSTKLRDQFDKENQDLGSVIQQAQLASTGKVLKTGVASLDDDSAVVLVVADADTTSKAQDSTRHFRWQVDLVKVKDEWLVDDFDAVTDPSAGVTQ